MATEERGWLIDIKQNLQSMEKWFTVAHVNPSIYKLPDTITSHNDNAYKPQTVSFGPYHHGKPDLMKDLESHKQRALSRFLGRSKRSIDDYGSALELKVGELKESYYSLDPRDRATQSLEYDRFLALMLYDGCFMLEVLKMAEEGPEDYASDDPIFSLYGRENVMPHIRRDMLVLENQLPMLLLKILLYVQLSKSDPSQVDDEILNRKILKFLVPNRPTRHTKLGSCLHVLDVYRKTVVEEPRNQTTLHTRLGSCLHFLDYSNVVEESRNPTTRHSRLGSCVHVLDVCRKTRVEEPRNQTRLNLTAVKLYEGGIKFKPNKSNSLIDISFHRGVLLLPVIEVDYTTESTLLNLMAFEKVHQGVGKRVTSYVYFMHSIIVSERDVNLLHDKGIIRNAIGSEAVANVFKTLPKGGTNDPESNLARVHTKLNEYYRNRWNEWRAHLINTYFKSPWTVLSVLVGFYVVVLASVQTVYTVYQYYHPSK